MERSEVFTWCMGFAAVVAVAALPVSCTKHRQTLVAEAIKNGADPIAAKCAIEGDSQDSKMCLVYAARHTQP